MTWRSFWAGHQAFFRHMTMAAKVGIMQAGWWETVGRQGGVAAAPSCQLQHQHQQAQAPAGMPHHLVLTAA